MGATEGAPISFLVDRQSDLQHRWLDAGRWRRLADDVSEFVAVDGHDGTGRKQPSNSIARAARGRLSRHRGSTANLAFQPILDDDRRSRSHLPCV